MGNCGLTLAPVKESDRENALVQELRPCRGDAARAPSKSACRGAGTPTANIWTHLEGQRSASTSAALVGHIAVRQYVMGEEAVERAATRRRDREDAAARARVAARAARFGMSTNRNERHMREDGKPVASRLADDDEIFALCDVLARAERRRRRDRSSACTKLEHSPGTTSSRAAAAAPSSGRACMHRWAAPDLWREQLDGIAPTFRDGYRAYGLANTVPLLRRFTLKNAQVFDEFPTWKTLMFLPEPVRKQAFADADTRAKLRAEMNAVPERPPSTAAGTWSRSSTWRSPRTRAYLGKSVADDGRDARPGPASTPSSTALARRGPRDDLLPAPTPAAIPRSSAQILQQPLRPRRRVRRGRPRPVRRRASATARPCWATGCATVRSCRWSKRSTS